VSVSQEAPADGSRTRNAGAIADVVVVLACYLVLGVACGVVWWLLVEPALFTKVHGGGTMSELQLSKEFNGDGWYAVIAAVVGISSGLVLTWWRSRDYLLTTVLLVPGSVLAAAVMAFVGHALGPGNPDAALATVQVGQHVPDQISVAAWATYLVWPIGVLVGALGVLWSTSRGSDREGD
jgi:hypothetical protein